MEFVGKKLDPNRLHPIEDPYAAAHANLRRPFRIQFTVLERSHWAGMGDFVLIPPDSSYDVTLRYEGEPPHGDSFHTVVISGRKLPGEAWGCMFAISACSGFIAFSWMARRFERRTIVVDAKQQRYFVLPQYIQDIRVEWPVIFDVASTDSYVFTDAEAWEAF